MREQIAIAIDRQDRLLLILSEASMKSGWVKDEVAKARAKENEGTARLGHSARYEQQVVVLLYMARRAEACMLTGCFCDVEVGEAKQVVFIHPATMQAGVLVVNKRVLRQRASLDSQDSAN